MYHDHVPGTYSHFIFYRYRSQQPHPKKKTTSQKILSRRQEKTHGVLAAGSLLF